MEILESLKCPPKKFCPFFTSNWETLKSIDQWRCVIYCCALHFSEEDKPETGKIRDKKIRNLAIVNNSEIR